MATPGLPPISYTWISSPAAAERAIIPERIDIRYCYGNTVCTSERFWEVVEFYQTLRPSPEVVNIPLRLPPPLGCMHFLVITPQPSSRPHYIIS